MPRRQKPLEEPRHAVDRWEASVFDRADRFVVCELRHDRRQTEFLDLGSAVEYARAREATGAVVYAIDGSRAIVLDRESWGEWMQRRERDGRSS